MLLANTFVQSVYLFEYVTLADLAVLAIIQLAQSCFIYFDNSSLISILHVSKLWLELFLYIADVFLVSIIDCFFC